MANSTPAASSAGSSLRATHVYALAAVCLVTGLACGYLLRASRMPSAPPAPARAPSAAAMRNGHMPSPEELRQIADKQVAPLLEKLKADPGNLALLLQVGAIYHGARQYTQAETFYARALQQDPKNLAIRTKLATNLFRSGDPDAAIAQLNQVLAASPHDANALFDLGVVRLEGKDDPQGAVAAWQRLLKSNPRLPADRKAVVLQLMAGVQGPTPHPHPTQGSAP